MHTRKTDELLLIEFVWDQVFDQPELIYAAERLKKCIDEGLRDYSTKCDDCDQR